MHHDDFKIQLLKESIEEAERFIKKAKAAKSQIEAVSKMEYDNGYGHGRQFGAAKRSALDLKMSLTRLNNDWKTYTKEKL